MRRRHRGTGGPEAAAVLSLTGCPGLLTLAMHLVPEEGFKHLCPSSGGQVSLLSRTRRSFWRGWHEAGKIHAP